MHAIVLCLLASQPLFSIEAPRGSHPPQVAAGPNGTLALLLPKSDGPTQLLLLDRSGKQVGAPRTVLESGLSAKIAWAPELEAWGVLAANPSGQLVFARVPSAPTAKVKQLEVPSSSGCGGDGRFQLGWSGAREEWLLAFGCGGELRVTRAFPTAPPVTLTLVEGGSFPSPPVWGNGGWLVAASTPQGARLLSLDPDGRVSARPLVGQVIDSSVVVSGREIVVATTGSEDGESPVRVTRFPAAGEPDSKIIATARGLDVASLLVPFLFVRPGGGFDLIVGDQTRGAEWPGHLHRFRLGPKLELTGERRRFVPDEVTSGWASGLATESTISVATQTGDPNQVHRIVVHRAPR